MRLGSCTVQALTTAEVLAEAQQAGSLRSGLDPQATAWLVLNPWEGTQILARADRSGAAFDSF
jgi:hypothetical protein